MISYLHFNCLPDLVLLYIMLYIMLAYLMLFAALSNAVCLYNVFFLNHAQFFYTVGFPNSMFAPFLYWGNGTYK